MFNWNGATKKINAFREPLEIVNGSSRQKIQISFISCFTDGDDDFSSLLGNGYFLALTLLYKHKKNYHGKNGRL
jgi:hypothetical protein